MSQGLQQWLRWLIPAVAIAVAFVAYEWDRPRMLFNPFCSARFAYRLDVTIEVNGEQYSSAATGEWLRNRIKTGGSCSQAIGSVLPFRLSDNRLVVIYAGLCPDAEKEFAGGNEVEAYDVGPKGDRADRALVSAMKEHKRLDIASRCFGISRNRSGVDEARYDGYFIDDADNPKMWRGFSFDRNPYFDGISNSERPSIVSAVAEATNRPPEDLLEKVAPAVLKTEFEGRWSKSPASLFDLRRSQQLFHDKSMFHASEEPHQVPTAPGFPKTR